MNNISKLFLNYSFMLVLLWVMGALTPYFDVRGQLLEIDLGVKVDKLSGGSSVKQIFWISLFCILFYNFFKGKICSLSTYILATKYFSAIVIVFIFSAIFSDFPMLTLKRSLFQFIFFHCVVFSFLAAYKNNTLERCVRWAIYVFLILVLIGLVKGTAMNLNHALAGFNFSKNRFCINLMVLLCLYAITHEKNELKMNNWILLVLVCLVVFSRGKTMILAMILLLPLLYFPKKEVILKGVNLGILVISIFIFIAIPFFVHMKGGMLNVAMYMESSDLTGRGVIWGLVYDSLEYYDKFYTGFGYGTFFNTPYIPEFFDVKYSFLPYVTTTHNGYIDLLSQIGFVGSIIAVMLVLVGVIYSQGATSQIGYYILLIHNITESSLFKDQHSVMLLLITLTCWKAVEILKANNVN